MRATGFNIFLFLLVFGGSLLGASAPAAAQGEAKIKIQVRSIQARADDQGKASFDKELGDIRGQLERGFPGYNAFRQIDAQRFTLSAGNEHALVLPNGQKMTLHFHGLAGDLIKLGLGVAGRMQTTLRASPGSTFFHAGLRHQGEMLVLAITVERGAAGD